MSSYTLRYKISGKKILLCNALKDGTLCKAFGFVQAVGKDHWEQMITFLSSNMIAFEESMRSVLLKIKKKLRS